MAIPNLELLAKDHVLDLLKDNTEELIKYSVDFINRVSLKEFDLDMCTYTDLLEWLDKDHSKLLFKLIARVVMDKQVTAQALTGMMFGQLRYNQSRSYIIDLMLNAVTKHPFISVKRVGMYLMFTCSKDVSDEIKQKRKAMSYVLPSTEIPLRVTDNKHIGYRTLNESIICGGDLKHHDLPLNLNHINRLNRNPYRIETRIQFLVKPKFDDEPKMKDNGMMEDEKDISKRFESWTDLMDELPEKISLMGSHGNRFYIHHKYDNGGRTYTKAFHFNYQGIAYLKSLVQSYTKELVEPEF